MEVDKTVSSLLCENSIFEGLTPEQVRDILPCITYAIKNYGTEECLYNKGDEVTGLGVVLEGRLTLCDEGPDGSRTVLSVIGENQMFGEDLLFCSQCGLPHKIIADQDAKVLYLSKDFFSRSCAKECRHQDAHQGIVRNMLRMLSDRAMMLNKKIAYLSAPDLKTKIAMYLYELYEMTGSMEFTMPLNRDRLAEFFAVARPSLSRELINLKNAGIITFHRSHVEVLDLEELRRISLGE